LPIKRREEPQKHQCRSCGAPFVFLTTESGRLYAIDPEPAENGNIWIGEDGIGRVVGKGDHETVCVPLYISHFATCLDAAKFRKKK
jgi:hypothetical protein